MAQAQACQPEPADQATVHHQSARQRRRKSAQVGQLNLTSMIDVIFQLLIFFVVTANFTIDEGVLSAKLPQGTGTPAAADELPRDKITIRLAADPSDDASVRIERGAADRPVRYVSFADLAADLDRLRFDPQNPRGEGIYDADNPVLIEPTGGVRWQHVVNAFNAAVAAKYTNVSFAPAKQ